MKSRSFASPLLLLAVVACGAPTRRVPVGLERLDPPPVIAPPPPQVMIALPAAGSSEPVVLATMSEARRREILLPSALSIEPYTPAPLPSRRRDVVVRHEYARPAPYYDHDYGCGYRGWYDDANDFARLATYTTAGAIIGHQFHERGRGAAIGAGVALLGWPFFGWGRGCRW